MRLELSDEANLGLEMNSVLPLHLALGEANELPHFLRGRVAEIDENVRVDVRDLRISDAMAFETALVDKATGADTFDLLEDAASARVPIEPRVFSSAPAEVFLHDAVKNGGISSTATRIARNVAPHRK